MVGKSFAVVINPFGIIAGPVATVWYLVGHKALEDNTESSEGILYCDEANIVSIICNSNRLGRRNFELEYCKLELTSSFGIRNFL